MEVLKGTVFAKSILLKRYIEKYVYDEKDISDPKFIHHIDKCMMKIQKKILFYSAEYKHQYDLRDLNCWTNLITKEMDEMKADGHISPLDLLEHFTYRLHYLSDRMRFERFIHLQMIWFYTRSRLVYIPSERGSYVEADDSFHPEIIPQWHD